MNPTARSTLVALPSPGEALELGLACERWRGQLHERHFKPRRVDHDVKAVTDCLRDLGSPACWTDDELRARFPRRRRGRSVDETPLEEIALRRFRAFYSQPEEHMLLTEILSAWWDRLLVSGRKVRTAEKYRDKVLRFVDRAGMLWRGSLRTMDRFGASRIEAGVARETLRGDQIAVRCLDDFILEPGEDEWPARILALTGCEMRQICTPANTLAHLHTCPEGEVGRAFTDGELRRFFEYLRGRVAISVRSHCKGRWTAERDLGMFQFMLGSGARCYCLEGFGLHDLRPAHGARARFSRFEDAYFESKSDPGGDPKPRIVPVIEIFAPQWAALDRYLRLARPHLVGPDSGEVVFLSERGRPLAANDISRIFTRHRQAAGLPDDLHAHCLRHTFAEQLGKIGLDLAIIQTLLGHNAESTTARYAKLTSAYVNDRLLECGRRQRRESDACA